MSLKTRLIVRNTPEIWDNMTLEEKTRQLEWCPYTDALIRQEYPGENVDDVVSKMNKNQLLALVNRALELWHKAQEEAMKKKGKKKSKEEKDKEKKAAEDREKQRKKETITVQE